MTIDQAIRDAMGSMSVAELHRRLMDAGYICAERSVRGWVNGERDVPRAVLGRLAYLLGMDETTLIHARSPKEGRS